MAVARTHRPVWQAERCMPCGACTRRCPASVFGEQVAEPDSLRGRVARQVEFPPGPARPSVPPCQAACPIGQDVPAYVQAVARGDLDAASRVIYRSNPLPSICGRLCLRACMHACVRGRLDEPVEIRALKRAAVELAARRPIGPPRRELDGRVVVVGAGPAGLATAFFLRRIGWQVRLLEAQAEAGGLLRWAVPAFDLPRAVLRAEVDALVGCGIELITGQRIESLGALRALQAAGVRAVVLATGAGRGVGLGVPGEQLDGSLDAIEFCRRYADGTGPGLSGPAVVAGAGPMALAAARLALRAGARPVRWILRRARREAAVDRQQLAWAEREGLEIVPEHWPIGLVGDDRLSAVRIEGQLYGPEDGVGRRWRVAAGAQREIEARWFIAADQRLPELGWLAGGPAGLLAPLGTLVVDPIDFQTRLPGVFAVGDVVTGARNAIEAIAQAMRVAVAVDRHCRQGVA